PWKGYFDMITAVDEFILYDDMQYTRRDWRNRNRIKTPHGLQWLSVPVKVKGKYHQTIYETEIDGEGWQQAHWKSLLANYRQAKCADEILAGLQPFYLEQTFTHLSDLNRALIEWVCDYLGIKTKISGSADYKLIEGKTERLVDLCQQGGATEYISGPAAQGYLDEKIFDAAGIKLTFFDYRGYSPYPQLWGEFEHAVTVLDLLLNCGPDSPNYMRYVRQ
ncbi:MAG: WbqC family protein, partial [Candidatus Nitrotoga sp.]